MVREEVAIKYDQAAKYYIQNDVVDLITKEDGMKSVQALIEAGICRLPFDPMMVEFAATPEIRWLILLEEQGEDKKFDFLCQCIFLHLTTGKTYYSSRNAELYMTNEGFMVDNVNSKQDGHAAVCALTTCLLLLNTKGIEKEVIHPTKLNIARAKSGKMQIPKVTTLRIGTVYDRDGKGHRVGPSGPPRVHLRAGHTRRQHHGPGNSQTKIVYIAPVLVNYNPELGDEVPKLPERRIKL